MGYPGRHAVLAGRYTTVHSWHHSAQSSDTSTRTAGTTLRRAVSPLLTRVAGTTLRRAVSPLLDGTAPLCAEQCLLDGTAPLCAEQCPPVHDGRCTPRVSLPCMTVGVHPGYPSVHARGVHPGYPSVHAGESPLRRVSLFEREKALCAECLSLSGNPEERKAPLRRVSPLLSDRRREAQNSVISHFLDGLSRKVAESGLFVAGTDGTALRRELPAACFVLFSLS